MEKKLCKINFGKKICGVCNGFADYLNLDVTVVRIIALILLFAFPPTFVIYLICALIMPEK